MMTLDYVGDGEAMEYVQLGQQPLVRTTATSLEPRRGTLSRARDVHHLVLLQAGGAPARERTRAAAARLARLRPGHDAAALRLRSARLCAC